MCFAAALARRIDVRAASAVAVDDGAADAGGNVTGRARGGFQRLRRRILRRTVSEDRVNTNRRFSLNPLRIPSRGRQCARGRRCRSCGSARDTDARRPAPVSPDCAQPARDVFRRRAPARASTIKGETARPEATPRTAGAWTPSGRGRASACAAPVAPRAGQPQTRRPRLLVVPRDVRVRASVTHDAPARDDLGSFARDAVDQDRQVDVSR
jgi:hypothetical protein